MNQILYSILDENMGQELTHRIALDIMRASSMLDTLVCRKDIEKIPRSEQGEVVFAIEYIEDIQDDIKPLHRSHWDETEEHRHGLPFNPDYTTFIRYERAGRYILFTIREAGKLIGNCAMYLDKSAHTQTLIASEDTLYLLPEARRGSIAKQFIEYAERALKTLGVQEITVTVKTINRAGLFFQRLGYRHVENGLTKVLEEQNVQSKTAEA